MCMVTLDEFENVALRAPARPRTWSVRSLANRLTSPKKVRGLIGGVDGECA